MLKVNCIVKREDLENGKIVELPAKPSIGERVKVFNVALKVKDVVHMSEADNVDIRVWLE